MEFVEIVAAPALAFGFVSFGLIFPLAAIALARPSRDGYFSFLIIATALGLFATAIFFVVGRYRVPWVPGLTLIAASGLVDLVRTVRNQDWSGLAWRVFLLGTPATLLTWHGMEDPAPARWSNQLVSTALAQLRTGRLEQAINALDLARASGPDGADKVRSLLSESPVHDLLAELVGRKTERMPIASPSDPRASIAVARYLRQLPETEGRAFAMLEQALRIVPDDRDANRELALHQLASRPDSEDTRGRALKALEAASRGSTPDPSAILYLALQRSDPSLMDEMDGRGLPEWRTTIKLVRAMIASRPKRPRTGSRS